MVLKIKSGLDFVPLAVAVLSGPFFVFPRNRWNWVLLVVVCLLWGGQRIFRREVLPKTPVDAAVALLLIMAFTGVFRIEDLGGSAGKPAGLVYGVVVFYILVDLLKSPGRIKAAVGLFLAGGMGLAVIGTLDRVARPEPFMVPIEAKLLKVPHLNLNLEGAENGVNPNPLGGLLLLFIPLAVEQGPLLFKKRHRYAPQWMRGPGLIGIAMLLGIFALAVFMTASFGTWIALALALWLMGRRRRPLKVVLAGLAMILVVLVIVKTDEAGQNGDSGLRGVIETSLKSRARIWKIGADTVEKHPLFGIGMDQLRRRPDFYFQNSHAHNQFLHTAAELGLPGLIAYAAILLGVFWMAGEIRASSLPEWLILTSRGLGTGIFAMTLFGLADAIPLGSKPGVLFWISLAMITSIYLCGRKNGLLGQNA